MSDEIRDPQDRKSNQRYRIFWLEEKINVMYDAMLSAGKHVFGARGEAEAAGQEGTEGGDGAEGTENGDGAEGTEGGDGAEGGGGTDGDEGTDGSGEGTAHREFKFSWPAFLDLRPFWVKNATRDTYAHACICICMHT